MAARRNGKDVEHDYAVARVASQAKMRKTNCVDCCVVTIRYLRPKVRSVHRTFRELGTFTQQ